MKIQAFAAASISEAIVAFAQFARSHHLNVGIQETQDALQAIKFAGFHDSQTLKYVLKPLFCTSPEECLIFEKLFLLFWDTNPLDLNGKARVKIEGVPKKKQSGSLVMMGKGESNGYYEEGKNVTGANDVERLRRTDFSKVNDIESKQLEQISEKLFRELAVRLRRRMKVNNRTGNINLRRTIRKSLHYGGETFNLAYNTQKPKKHRLIILLDASGSMDKYSFFLLRFVFALKRHFRQLEAFVFSTKLMRISNAVAHNQLEYALAQLSQQVNNWSSGTKIGNCLMEFNDIYGKRILNGSPTFIILSDGLDTGEPEILGKELSKIKSRTKRIVWLNPLKGMKDYQPVQRGMKEALPNIDDFRAAHNINSLLELENILNYA